MHNQSATILLVEDDETHAMLIIRSFESMRIEKIYWVCDGEEAMDYLLHREAFADRKKSPRPDLILLDLKIPKLDGHEVLWRIKNLDELKAIPVVVLTTSHNERDLRKAYLNHANSYLVKPLGIDQFLQLTQHLSLHWLEWNWKLQGDLI
jgi:two-component system, response regulator